VGIRGNLLRSCLLPDELAQRLGEIPIVTRTNDCRGERRGVNSAGFRWKPRSGRCAKPKSLLLSRSLRCSPQESALEQGWLLAETGQRIGYGFEELARRFDRSNSWVSLG
jgi:hypothetical protein